MASEDFKILITDDDIDLRELLTEAVKNWGYAVCTSKDGEEALRRLKMDKYDIVITDLMMPVMDGLTLLNKIKELDKEILVIIITGYATIDTAVKAIEAGAYDYIAKPFRLDELMIVLNNACERLKLTAQNKALLQELRNAYAEISMLRDTTGRSSAGPKSDEADGAPDKKGDQIEKDSANLSARQEYMKEADRFIRKPVSKN